MRGFRFSLDRLLRLKERKEEQMKNELKRKRDEIAAVEEKLKELEEGIEQAYEEERKIIMGEDESLRREDVVVFRAQLHERKKETEKKLLVLRAEERALMKRLVEVMKEKRTLERLKERRYREFAMEQNRQDMRTMDEIALRRFMRRRESG
mgnify:FL=1